MYLFVFVGCVAHENRWLRAMPPSPEKRMPFVGKVGRAKREEGFASLDETPGKNLPAFRRKRRRFAGKDFRTIGIFKVDSSTLTLIDEVSGDLPDVNTQGIVAI